MNRFLSTFFFTPLLCKTSLTPNQVTVLSLLFGIGSGLLFATGNSSLWLLAAFSLQMAAILDDCDGDIARIKNMRSKFGGWLDVSVDLFVDIAFFGGLAVGLWKQGSQGPVVLCVTL